MRYLFAGLFLFAALTAMVQSDSTAGEKKKEAKEVTLKGKILCGKCELNLDAQCATAIAVKGDKKDILYYFDKAAHDKYHEEVCAGAKKGTVVGTVETKDKKNTIKVTSVKFE